MDELIYLSLDEQIKKLKAQNLSITNEDQAKSILST